MQGACGVAREDKVERMESGNFTKYAKPQYLHFDACPLINIGACGRIRYSFCFFESTISGNDIAREQLFQPSLTIGGNQYSPKRS